MWRVFSTAREKIRISEGIRKNTLSMLMTIPFASTTPISKPMVNCMNTSDRSPAIVVRLEEETATMDEDSAAAIASLRSSQRSHSSL